MKIQYRIYRVFYKLAYFLNPVELLKKFIKIILVSKEIFLNKVTYYPKSVIKFENKFANYIGKEYGLTFCNGTSSIESAVFALSIQNDDEVLVPSCTFHASIDPIINAGATPIFVDTLKDSILISLDDLESKITNKTKAIVIVHVFGYAVDMDKVLEIANKYNLKIIEDVSHAHGGEYKDRKLGSFGDISCFSLQGAKAIAAGEGGITLTDDKELFAKMSMYGHFNRHSNIFDDKYTKYKKIGIGHKMRAHPLGIVLALVDLWFIDIYNKKMQKNEVIIKDILKEILCITLFEPVKDSKSGGFFSGIPILVQDNVDINKVKNTFLSYGISVSHYPFELHHKLEVYNQDKNSILQNTEKLKDKIIMIDRRILIFLPFFTKVILKKIEGSL